MASRGGLVQLDWNRYPRLKTVWADGVYQGAQEDWAAGVLGLWLQLVHKLPGAGRFRRADQALDRGAHVPLARALPPAQQCLRCESPE